MCLFKRKKNENNLPTGKLVFYDGVDGVFDGVSDYEFVDLGLSVKWANKNVGAELPDKVGVYFNYDEAEDRFYDLPTVDEVRELFEKCKIKYNKNKKGFDVVGVNGNSIFLPISGERDGNAHYEGSYFWTCDSEPVWPDELSNYYGAVYLANKTLKKVKTEVYPLRRSVFYINVREVER
jgi:hypothetical protein